MANREQLKAFFSGDWNYIKLHDHELYNLLKVLQPDDVKGMDEHRRLLELIADLRQMIEHNNELNGENFNATLKSILSVGEDGLYSDPLRFLFELIQNVDDCEYDDIASAKLRIVFQGNTIQLTYNEHGFSPFNVFAITGIAEAAKNIDDSKVEIGEKGLGFKSVFGIAESVLIQSGFFSFRLNKDHFTIPVPEYEGFSRVEGTQLTLTLKSTSDVDRICKLIKDRYCKPNAIFQQNPMLFLNKLTELDLRVDNASRQLLFAAERKEKQPISSQLAVEQDVTISASLKTLSADKAKGDFSESIVGDRYTYSALYTRSMCVSRYGSNTRLRKKVMPFQVIFPHVEYLGTTKAIGTGALYSFLPTQVTVNAPIIIHAPFKLDGSREYVDSQNNNEWFQHTIHCLFAMLNESLVDMAQKVHEDVLRYIPKKFAYIFSGSKTHSLHTSEYTGEKLLSGKIFWCIDQKFHHRKEIVTYGGDLSFAEQEKIHALLKNSNQLFHLPEGLTAKEYNISFIEDPYYLLFTRALADAEIMRSALPIFDNWAGSISETELIKRLNDYIPIIQVPNSSHLNEDTYRKKISLTHVELMAGYPKFSKVFSKWLQRRLEISGTRFLFKCDDARPICNITTIDPDNPFELSDVSSNMRKYLQSISCKCTLVSGDCICVPTKDVLFLSQKNCLDLFAAFCKVMDRNSQFEITLRLMADSKELDNAEKTMSAEEFIQRLKAVRLRSKISLGKSYESYLHLLSQAGAGPVRFLDELFQNADDCIYPEESVPELVIKTTPNTLIIQYNENGFEKENVRAITSIGESTKKQLLNNQWDLSDTIGEKGIGFKSVFSIAKSVYIHSNGFHFGLKDSAPTIPILDIEEKYQDEQGTYMEMELKKPIPADLLSKSSLLSLCLCLRNIKKITCNNTEVEICDTNGLRKIKIDHTVHEFEVHKHPFKITDHQAIQERQHGNRKILPDQCIFCYIPVSLQRKSEYYLYNGLPTQIRINIPMYIDAPFELTTSRDNVLENNWNRIVREHVYRAIYEYTNIARNKLCIRALRFVSVKPNTYENNTFEANKFLNAVALRDYAKSNIYVPAVNEQLYKVQSTTKYPVFIRLMILSALSRTALAASTLDYSDDEYNSSYSFLGGKIAKTDDILHVLQQANLQRLLQQDETFRKQLYAFLENEKGIASSVRSLFIIPVWDTSPGTTRYVAANGTTPIYRELGKKVSASKDYWVLNEEQMSPVMFTRITGNAIETMDHNHAVQMYKEKLLFTIRSLSPLPAYRYLLTESSRTPMLIEALQSMLSKEKSQIPLQNLDGEIVDSSQVFTLNPDQNNIFGKMLRKYASSPECYVLAVSLERKPLEDIQFGDVEDYGHFLSSDDLEDLLKSDSPRIRYGRSIAREFYEEGKVDPKAAEEYGLVFTVKSAESKHWAFPKSRVQNRSSLISQMNSAINIAPRRSTITKSVEISGWIQNGQWLENAAKKSRDQLLYTYRAEENRSYSFCQMCKEAKQQTYIEVPCILAKPQMFLPELHLSLCLECSKRFQGLRDLGDPTNSPFLTALYQKIMNTRINGSGVAEVELEEDYNLTLTFTETHLAQIQAVLPKLTGVTAKPADDIPHSYMTKTVNPVSIVSLSSARPISTAARAPVFSSANKSDDGRMTFTIHLSGENAGNFKMIVYKKGKLKKYTKLPHEELLIRIIQNGKQKRIPVHFVKAERTIYISNDEYTAYRNEIRKMMVF